MINSVKGLGCIKETCIYKTFLTITMLNHTFYCINTYKIKDKIKKYFFLDIEKYSLHNFMCLEMRLRHMI